MVGTDGRVKIRVGDGVVDQQCQYAAAPTRAVSSDESVVGEGGGLGAGGQLGLLEGSHQDMMFVEEGLELGGGVFDAIAVKLQDVGGVSGARSGGGRQGRGRCWGGGTGQGGSAGRGGGWRNRSGRPSRRGASGRGQVPSISCAPRGSTRSRGPKRPTMRRSPGKRHREIPDLGWGGRLR